MTSSRDAGRAAQGLEAELEEEDGMAIDEGYEDDEGEEGSQGDEDEESASGSDRKWCGSLQRAGERNFLRGSSISRGLGGRRRGN